MFGELWYITVIAIGLLCVLLILGMFYLAKKTHSNKKKEGNVLEKIELHQAQAKDRSNSDDADEGELDGINLRGHNSPNNIVPATPDSDTYATTPMGTVDFADATTPIADTSNGIHADHVAVDDGGFDSSSSMAMQKRMSSISRRRAKEKIRWMRNFIMLFQMKPQKCDK